MAKRNIARDYAEIAKFAQNFIGQDVEVCAIAYAHKRKIVGYRAINAFWAAVDDGKIEIGERKEIKTFRETTGKVLAVGDEGNDKQHSILETHEIQAMVKIPFIAAVNIS